MQAGSVSFTVPGQMQLEFSGSFGAGDHRVVALVKPNQRVEILGVQNTLTTTGTLGGATFEVDVPSGSITGKSYLVETGDGIVYNGVTYLPGEVFNGTSTVATYTQAGATSSRVRQYALNYLLALPPGDWQVWLEYTNLSGSTDHFYLKAEYAASGAEPVPVIQDLAPLPFVGANGDINITPVAGMEVTDASTFSFPVYWTGGDGQLHVRRLIFESAVETGRFAISGTFAGSTAQVDVVGRNQIPGIMQWSFASAGSVVNPTLTLDYTADATLPLQIQQLHVQQMDYYATTPLSESFQGWRQECLERAERTIQQSYRDTLTAFGTEVPTFRDAGSRWSATATEEWMSFVEVCQPRLRELLNIDPEGIVDGFQYQVDTASVTYDGTVYTRGQKFYGVESAGTVYSGGTVRQVGALMRSLPGHVGRPALVPTGLYFDDSDRQVKAYYDTVLAEPKFMACQPWMIEQGLYVVQDEFWMPAALGTTLPVPNIVLFANPVGGGTVLGGGSFRLGTPITISAVANILSYLVDVAVDMVFVVDESGSMSDIGTIMTDVTTGLEAALNASGIGTGSLKNRFGVTSFGHGAPATVEIDFEEYTDFIVDAAGLGPRTLGVLDEDAYDGIDTAINDMVWRNTPYVSKIIFFVTDEDRNVHIYADGADQAAQFTNLKAQLVSGGFLLVGLHNPLDSGLRNGSAVAAIGGDYSGKCYLADGAGGYTVSTGFNNLGTTSNGDTLGYPTGQNEEYFQLCMDADVQGYMFSLLDYRLGGFTQQSINAAIVPAMAERIAIELSWSFAGWYEGGVLVTTSPDYSFTVTQSRSLTAMFTLA